METDEEKAFGLEIINSNQFQPQIEKRYAIQYEKSIT